MKLFVDTNTAEEIILIVDKKVSSLQVISRKSFKIKYLIELKSKSIENGVERYPEANAVNGL